MFFIYDCNGKVVGNPKGYATIKGAIRQQDQVGSPAYRAIWDAFYKKYGDNPQGDGLLISQVKGAA